MLITFKKKKIVKEFSDSTCGIRGIAQMVLRTVNQTFRGSNWSRTEQSVKYNYPLSMAQLECNWTDGERQLASDQLQFDNGG